MLFKRSASILVVVGFAALFAAPVRGQEAKASPGSAKALYEAGIDLTVQKKFPEAEAKFLEAWALQKSYDVAANLGEVEMQLDKPAEAAGYLTYARKNFPASGKKEKLDWIENRLKDARAKVAALIIAVNVPGAEVRVNGRPAGAAPLDGEVFAAAGDCTVTVTAPNYQPYGQVIRVVAGAAHTVQVTLEEAPQRSALPAIALGGVGLVGFATGIALYVVSSSKYDEAKSLSEQIKSTNSRCPDGSGRHPKCDDLKSAAETSDALSAPGLGLIIGGALLTAAGGAYLGYSLKSSPPPPGKAAGGLTVTAVGLRGPGLFVQGSF